MTFNFYTENITPVELHTHRRQFMDTALFKEVYVNIYNQKSTKGEL